MWTKVVSPDEAVSIIKSNDTLVLSGNMEMLLPDLVLKALENRFLKKNTPKELTLFYPVMPGAQHEGTGIDRLAHKGMLKRVIASSFSTMKVKKICNLILNNEIEAYLQPMGTNFYLLRAIAAGMPGHITSMGINTFIDPRNGGNKLTEKTKEDIVKIIKIDSEEYLFYKSFPIDIAIIRGTTSDLRGNISIEHEPLKQGLLDIAMATKNSGGKVIAQVERITDTCTIKPQDVVVPEIFVDKIVVDENQQGLFGYNCYLSNEVRIPYKTIKSVPLNWKTIIAKRAAMEMKKGMLVNIGFGIPAIIPNVACKENIINDVCFSVEHGPLGGMPAAKESFGAAYNSSALMDSPDVFAMYDTGRLDLAFLGMAQIDSSGNVNVSNIKGKYCLGGFLDIVWETPKIVFCGSFLAEGFKANIHEGKISIIEEGKIIKFVNNVDQITFSGERALRKNQNIIYVTERAVFELTKSGMKLIEVAPGIDIKSDILDKMEFMPIIVDKNIRLMPSVIFKNKE